MTDPFETRSNVDDQVELGQTAPSIPPMISKPARANESLQLWAALQSGWLGVILMGGVYGLVVPLSITFLTGSVTGIASLALWITMLIVGVVLGPTLGLVSGASSSVVAILTVAFANETFGSALNRRAAVAVFGGMTGFLSTFWWMLAISDLKFWLIGGCLVGLAVAMGQIGALAWAGRSGLWEMMRASANSKPIRFQFQIRHLLVAMIWCSVILALDRFCSNHELVKFVGAYLVVQSVFVWLDQQLVKRRQAKIDRARVNRT